MEHLFSYRAFYDQQGVMANVDKNAFHHKLLHETNHQGRRS